MKGLIFIGLLVLTQAAFAQNFLQPSDSLNHSRRNVLFAAETGLVVGGFAVLSQSWYSDYEKSNFHFVNDNDQWLQMDKAGHLFAAYHLSRFNRDLFQWSGMSDQNSLILGSASGFAIVSAIEIFDGYSKKWGASAGDLAANATGTVLFLGQELLWNEQRITPKFSFHTTEYASARPDALGESASEQLLKDYNGQTYWLSANLHSFSKSSKLPKWLNLAVGYGAEGMITGQDELVNSVFFSEKKRVRQFYLSLDADLTKIKTKRAWLKTLFAVLNTVKLPAPTLEMNAEGVVKFHAIYF